jgi:hypothetical protein
LNRGNSFMVGITAGFVMAEEERHKKEIDL